YTEGARFGEQEAIAVRLKVRSLIATIESVQLSANAVDVLLLRRQAGISSSSFLSPRPPRLREILSRLSNSTCFASSSLFPPAGSLPVRLLTQLLEKPRG